VSLTFEESRNIVENTIPKRVLAYFDHCVFFARRVDHATASRLEKAGFDIRDRYGRYPGKKLSIKGPSRSALHLISTIRADPYSAELALDMGYENLTPVRQAMRMGICQPWAGKRRVVDLGGTAYTGQRKPGRHQHFAMYSDKASRITGETDTVHLEKRIQGLQLLRKIGIIDVPDMLDFDHVAFWRNTLPRLFLYLDLSRYGRLLHNRSMHAKRRALMTVTGAKWGFVATQTCNGLSGKPAGAGTSNRSMLAPFSTALRPCRRLILYIARKSYSSHSACSC
jgi:hypothetical protein